MSSNSNHVQVPAVVQQKLRTVRRQAAALRLVETVVVPLAVLLGAMMLMMLLDWTMEFRRGWRLLTTASALIATAAAVVWGVGRLIRVGRSLSAAGTEGRRAGPPPEE